MLLADLVDASTPVGATCSRKLKLAALADVLGRVEPDQAGPAAAFLAGQLRQGRVGVGWALISAIGVDPAPSPTLTVVDVDVDEALAALAGLAGRGSATTRSAALTGLFARATAAEANFLRRLLLGDLRQGALEALVTDALAVAAAFAEDAIAAGHEGVMVKGATSRYEAGRRGSAWRKVKPVRTLDLVVLGAEWGHGRRRGRLSNLHLGARDPDGSFLMVGKTFKGLTDALLAWQTERLRPELVVEIALDGVLASDRYPGGVSLRFARVRRYRPDKTPADADDIATVRALRPGSG